MDYALLMIGIALLAAIGVLWTAVKDVHGAVMLTRDVLVSYLKVMRTDIHAIPKPEAPDLSALDAIHEKVVNFAPQPVPATPDLSVLGEISTRLGLLDKLGEALVRKRDEPARKVPAPAIERAVQKTKAGRELLRQRLAQRQAGQ